MPAISEIQKVVTDLAERQIINPETRLKDLMAVNVDLVPDPSALAGWYVIGGEHFIIVCGKESVKAISNPLVEHGKESAQAISNPVVERGDFSKKG